MEAEQTYWTKKECKAYILIYCMHADAVDKLIEKDFIIQKVGQEVFDTIYAEFSADSDFSCVNKIQSSLAQLNLSTTEKEALKTEVRNLFNIDGKFNMIEKGVESTLKKILNS